MALNTPNVEGADVLAPTVDIIDTNELEEKMEEVDNGEDHRVKGGRELKASS